MKAILFNFNKINIGCIGKDIEMQDLLNFYHLKVLSNSDLDMNAMIQRINNNNIYCYVKENGFLNKIAAFCIKSRIKKELLIDESDFLEGMFLTKPNEMCRALNISEENIKSLKENTRWTNWNEE